MFEGKLYELNSDKPFSGMIFNTYPSGLREYEGEYKNGKPNGLLTYWYNNGNKMREGKLKNGIQTNLVTHSIKEMTKKGLSLKKMKKYHQMLRRL